MPVAGRCSPCVARIRARGPLGWSPGSVLPSCVSSGKLLALSELDTGGSKSFCRWITGMEPETHSQDPLTGRTPKPPSLPVHSVSGERVPGKRLLSPPPRPVCLLRPQATAPPTRQEKGAVVLLSVWFPRASLSQNPLPGEAAGVWDRWALVPELGGLGHRDQGPGVTLSFPTGGPLTVPGKSLPGCQPPPPTSAARPRPSGKQAPPPTQAAPPRDL